MKRKENKAQLAKKRMTNKRNALFLDIDVKF